MTGTDPRGGPGAPFLTVAPRMTTRSTLPRVAKHTQAPLVGSASRRTSVVSPTATSRGPAAGSRPWAAGSAAPGRLRNRLPGCVDHWDVIQIGASAARSPWHHDVFAICRSHRGQGIRGACPVNSCRKTRSRRCGLADLDTRGAWCSSWERRTRSVFAKPGVRRWR